MTINDPFTYVKSLYAVEETDTTPLFYILNRNTDVDVTKLARSPKNIYAKAVLMTWQVHLIETVTRHRATYLDKDGVTVKKDGTKSMKGDLKAKEKYIEHLFMHAQDPSGQVGFCATWSDNSFVDVLVRDPYGIHSELYFDYAPDHLTVNARGKANAESIGSGADAAYNDGVMVKVKRKLYTSTAEFVEWLDSWLAATGHEVKKKAPAKKKAVGHEPTGLELITTGEWS